MSVAEKMRLKDAALLLIKCPDDCRAHFDVFEVKTSLAGKNMYTQAVLFTEHSAVLNELTPRLLTRLEGGAIFWVAYPKKASKIPTDMSRDYGWEIFLRYGYEAVTSVAIDDNWSALRFRKTEDIGPKLRDTPQAARKIDGVDFVNRTVTLPADAEKKLKKFSGLTDFFYAMSFTHKKEHVEAIAGAKKEETRIKRIDKMVEMLLKMRDEKELKKKTKK